MYWAHNKLKGKTACLFFACMSLMWGCGRNFPDDRPGVQQRNRYRFRCYWGKRLPVQLRQNKPKGKAGL